MDLQALLDTARAANARFPEGNTPYQIVARLLEECGEVSAQVAHWEGSGIKRRKHGEPSREAFAGELRQAVCALMQLVLYYGLEDDLAASVEASLARSRAEGLLAEDK